MDEGTLRLMRQWGAPAEELEMAQALMDRAEQDEPAEVWPENWETWLFFMRVQTQWVFAGMAGARVALRWEGIEPVAAALGLRRRRWRELVEALGVIEHKVLATEQRQRERKRNG